MSTSPASPLHCFLRQLACSKEAVSDAELLQRFLNNKDQHAFADLVTRYGSMVSGVCNRILQQPSDAEDAMQATFLILAGKAATLSNPEKVGNWLYGVAVRVARKARRCRNRRKEIQGDVNQCDGRSPIEISEHMELIKVLDEEVWRLPARYREPLIRHYLQGLTQEAVAMEMGCPRKTITTRLARARARLRAQLSRRGITSASSMLVVLSSLRSGNAASIQPAMDVTETVLNGKVNSSVQLMAKGALQAMFLSKSKILAITLTLLLMFTWTFVGTDAAGGTAQAAAPIKAVKGAQPPGGDPTTPAEYPPVVVKTLPEAGDLEVDAKTTKEIRVKFSKKMQRSSWSIVQISKATFPKVNGKVSFAKDQRTCVIPVSLQPGKTYVLWFNQGRYMSFRDTDQKKAVPYLLTFQTKK